MNSVNYQIWDTAGIRKKSKISEHAEKLSVMSSLNAAEEFQIVILMIDSQRDLKNKMQILQILLNLKENHL